MLRRLPGVFAAGEMLDWEAPTGGYLLQACFATGAAAGKGALRWLDEAVALRAWRGARHQLRCYESVIGYARYAPRMTA